MTDIVICGACGSMGRTIAGIIEGRGDCRTVAGIDIRDGSDCAFPVVSAPSELPVRPDVIIDFSGPASLDGLLSYCRARSVPLVIGSTGYSQAQIGEIRAAAEAVPVFFTFNMSLGINLLSALAVRAAQVLGDGFDVEIIEKHHNRKVDAPSGTAIMLAGAINGAFGGSKHYVYDRHGVRAPRDSSEIGIHSVRGGTIVGEHEIIFAGNDEVITLSHSAQSKTVFAQGAVNAAMFLKDRGPGLYDMGMLVGGEVPGGAERSGSPS